MNFSFENQGNATYLVMELPVDAELDTMTLGMITNNNIPGVASVIFTQIDNVKYVKYNISAKISLAQMFEGTVNRRKILGAFSGICDSLLNAEDYMLEFNNFIFDMDKIYVNVSTLEVSLICIPFVGMQQNMQNLGMLFKTIMFSTQFDTTENNDYVGKIINYLNGPNFSVKEFKELLDILQGNVAVAPSTPAPVAPASVGLVSAAPAPVALSANVSQPSVQAVPAPAPAVAQPVKMAQPVSQPQVNVATPVAPPMPVQNPGMAIPPMGIPQPPAKNGKEKKVKAPKEPKAPKAPKEPKPSKKDKMKGMGVPVPGMAIPGQPNQPVVSQPMAQPVVPQPAVQATRPAVQPIAPQPIAQPVVPQPMAQPVTPQVMAQPVAPKMTGFTGNFGETTVLGSTPTIGETTVLGVSPAAQVQPYLIRKKTDERIPLNKPVFRIGKEKSYVDYFISDNTAISRSHANVVIRDGKYYVIDTNSTNHTFVNGQLLQSNVETEITHGAVVKLANEEFEFRAF